MDAGEKGHFSISGSAPESVSHRRGSARKASSAVATLTKHWLLLRRLKWAEPPPWTEPRMRAIAESDSRSDAIFEESRPRGKRLRLRQAPSFGPRPRILREMRFPALA